MNKVWSSLPWAERRRIQIISRVVEAETQKHVGRILGKALAPFPKEGAITINVEWLHNFAADLQKDYSYRFSVNTDHIFERAIQALDKEEKST